MSHDGTRRSHHQHRNNAILTWFRGRQHHHARVSATPGTSRTAARFLQAFLEQCQRTTSRGSSPSSIRSRAKRCASAQVALDALPGTPKHHRARAVSTACCATRTELSAPPAITTVASRRSRLSFQTAQPGRHLPYFAPAQDRERGDISMFVPAGGLTVGFDLVGKTRSIQASSPKPRQHLHFHP